jgi:hypothetical protein
LDLERGLMDVYSFASADSIAPLVETELGGYEFGALIEFRDVSEEVRLEKEKL